MPAAHGTRSTRAGLALASLIALSAPACQRPPTSSPRAEPPESAAQRSALRGTWHAQPPPPLIETQLSPACHELLTNIASTDATLTFEDREVVWRAASLGGLASHAEARFAWSRPRDLAHVTVAVDAYDPPPVFVLPCGALPGALVLSPSGEELTSNVIGCAPCAHEPAIDGLVGLRWRR
ncbi:MAG: hypothetical protein U0353_32365 [Sandaracinus sp.]